MKVIKTNADKLIKISVMGEVSSPIVSKSIYRISANGIPAVLPGVGGITYNLRVGDFACGWEADHVEPGVSVENKENDSRYGNAANIAFSVFSCIGNQALVVNGDAKGSVGFVTGKNGGIEHVLVDFQSDVLEKLIPGDKILIKAIGVGLKLLDYSSIKIMNMDPKFLKVLNPKEINDKLLVPVTHIIPAAIMGSGLGKSHAYSGDYDLQMFDRKSIQEYGLDDLKIGDIVAITDADHSFGRIYRQGAVSVGIVVHTNCITAGHGPGITSLMTSSLGNIVPKIDKAANIAYLLEIRSDI
jgi:hypothetical protein